MADEKIIEEKIEDAAVTEEKDKNQQMNSEMNERKPENFVERIYDHIPLTYKQVDIFTKVVVAILIIVLAVAIIDAR